MLFFVGTQAGGGWREGETEPAVARANQDQRPAVAERPPLAAAGARTQVRPPARVYACCLLPIVGVLL